MRAIPFPWPLDPGNPELELDAALDRGDLSLAKVLAAEAAEDRGKPIDLATAARFLPLVAAAGEDYERWSKRWLVRWLSEAEKPSIEAAARVCGGVGGWSGAA